MRPCGSVVSEHETWQAPRAVTIVGRERLFMQNLRTGNLNRITRRIDPDAGVVKSRRSAVAIPCWEEIRDRRSR